MINISLRQLLKANGTNPVQAGVRSDGKPIFQGSLARFYACPKTTTAVQRWEARNAPDLVDRLVADYVKAERELFEKYGDATRNYEVSPAQREAFDKERNALLDKKIEGNDAIPGEPVPVDCLLGDTITELDMKALEPFLAPPLSKE